MRGKIAAGGTPVYTGGVTLRWYIGDSGPVPHPLPRVNVPLAEVVSQFDSFEFRLKPRYLIRPYLSLVKLVGIRENDEGTEKIRQSPV